MLGDAFARGKRGSTRAHGPEYKERNSRGRSHKHVQPSTGKDDTISGGHSEQRKIAKAMHSSRGGPVVRDRQAPHKQKEPKELRHVDQGDLINQWALGKRKTYR